LRTLDVTITVRTSELDGMSMWAIKEYMQQVDEPNYRIKNVRNGGVVRNAIQYCASVAVVAGVAIAGTLLFL